MIDIVTKWFNGLKTGESFLMKTQNLLFSNDGDSLESWRKSSSDCDSLS